MLLVAIVRSPRKHACRLTCGLVERLHLLQPLFAYISTPTQLLSPNLASSCLSHEVPTCSPAVSHCYRIMFEEGGEIPGVLRRSKTPQADAIVEPQFSESWDQQSQVLH